MVFSLGEAPDTQHIEEPLKQKKKLPLDQLSWAAIIFGGALIFLLTLYFRLIFLILLIISVEHRLLQ